ncbi:hypothetical protein HanRHA438_Chr05g0225631 [Helianthus annuus]|uniref:Uncharacterized protein n=1 Tax=Helianthus annuus TaxID=4232 RepID=A0A251UQW3_HELAN|nr:hypothetical protein HanXRQr2_Chr05g0216341 [Helianthus annuus]KAJ0570342.1 hypothetical protein HanHA300_Chr05g0176951 [Helianthus annuus]KAJ0584686.1 hypothetical protein HanHA89_Chr05g0191601 [Helianthus annuus]KAJ0750353.1 hypothetical protein HanLR1_Chr05g0181031 [Helianthus annuus]KAJ0919090.1 hypothetical protein HanRHA438_Chr05g0225631 [Helianthus annuus]
MTEFEMGKSLVIFILMLILFVSEERITGAETCKPTITPGSTCKGEKDCNTTCNKSGDPYGKCGGPPKRLCECYSC